MSSKKQFVLIGIIFAIGLSLVLYPVIGNVLNTIRNNREIQKFEETLDMTSPDVYKNLFENAREINKLLPGTPTVYDKTEPFYEDYETALCEKGGMMGYVIIDKIDVKLSILHGTSDGVLQNAVGYLEGTHLPTGDVGNSTVLTGHTGLPSAELFTNLDQLEIGDTFQLAILNKVFTYEVFEIDVVLPYQVDSVQPREGIDMVTLLTCTPYGINSHRLLVHGKQIELDQSASTTPKTQITQTRWNLQKVIPIILLVILSVAALYVAYLLFRSERE